MKADSIHGSIGTKMRAAKNIYSFDDFVDICENSSKKIKPVTITYGDFFELSAQHRTRSGKRTQMPLLANVCDVRFVKGKGSSFYKQDFNDEYTEVDFLKSKFSVMDPFPKRNEAPRGIPKSEKTGILKVMDGAPPAKKLLWIDLPENDTVADHSNAVDSGL